MKTFKLLFTTAFVSLFLFSCQKTLQDPSALSQKNGSVELEKKNGVAGYVYTLTNQVAGNNVIIYTRTAGGEMAYNSAVATGGSGTGAGLGSQGAIVLSENNDWLLAVNAGSNSISSLYVNGASVQSKATVSSGGTMPISVTIHSNIVYVLNGGGSGNITGFTLHADGSLQPIPGSERPLSSSASGPAQISFVNDGNAVAITEKATNKIITYTIGSDGVPGAMHVVNAASPTPFGFAAGKNGMLYVSEAAGGAPAASAVSSYHVSADGSISHVGGPVFANQTAACWVVVTNNGKYVYATNTGSGTVSSFAAGNGGSLSLASAVAGNTGMGSTPIDAALSNNSKFLYELNSSSHTIKGFAVEHDGSLNIIHTVGSLPAGTIGLAAK
jgi:6-phosphogluconolactonase